jgi:hypothetical protein
MVKFHYHRRYHLSTIIIIRRTAHDAIAMQVYLDGKKLGLFIRREVYGIFLRFMSEAGQNSYNTT